MRTTRLLGVVLLVISLSACANSKPQQVGTPALSSEPWQQAISVIKQNALDGDKPDWRTVEIQIAADDTSDATAKVRAVLAAYKDPHAAYFTREEAQAWQTGAPQSQTGGVSSESAATQPVQLQPAIPELPWGRIIEGNIAYLGLPPCGTGEPEALQGYGRALREHINVLTSQRAQFWIVDLRLNGGGNVWPMLAGLQPLLGNGEAFRAVQPHDSAQIFGCAGNTAWLQHGATRTPQFTLENVIEHHQPVVCRKLAVLLGSWTMSSGEMIAVALIAKPQAKSFGEPTAGLTTITGFFPLDDGSMLVVPTGRVAPPEAELAEGEHSKSKPIIGKIQPSHATTFGDWPLIDDATVEAAIKWIRE